MSISSISVYSDAHLAFALFHFLMNLQVSFKARRSLTERNEITPPPGVIHQAGVWNEARVHACVYSRVGKLQRNKPCENVSCLRNSSSAADRREIRALLHERRGGQIRSGTEAAAFFFFLRAPTIWSPSRRIISGGVEWGVIFFFFFILVLSFLHLPRHSPHHRMMHFAEHRCRFA